MSSSFCSDSLGLPVCFFQADALLKQDDTANHENVVCNDQMLTTSSTQADKARVELAKAENQFDHLRKDTNQKINEFDRKVEKKAAEAKSGLSSWFGGK